MCPRRPLIAHENAFYLAGLQMEPVKSLPRHLAIDLGDALTRSFSRSRHRFVAISNCDGVSADAVLWPSSVTSTLIIQPIAMAASSLKRHHSKSLGGSNQIPRILARQDCTGNFPFCCRRRSLACSCRQRLIFARDLLRLNPGETAGAKAAGSTQGIGDCAVGADTKFRCNGGLES